MSIRIVLVGTTHPGNIGAVARAMKNMGLSDLRLVSPKYFPHEEATARASGASDILELAVVTETLAEALEGCVYVAGASARSRTINWPCMGPRDCAERLIRESANGDVACVFGPEKTGLHNDDLDLCHTLLTIPTDPGFSSLNLAMARTLPLNRGWSPLRSMTESFRISFRPLLVPIRISLSLFTNKLMLR